MEPDLPNDKGSFGVSSAWRADRCVWVWLHSPLPAFPDPRAQQGAVCLRCRRRTWKQSLYGHVVVRLLQNESECCYIRGVGQAGGMDRLLSNWNTHFRWRMCERGKLETHTHTHVHTHSDGLLSSNSEMQGLFCSRNDMNEGSVMTGTSKLYKEIWKNSAYT